VISYKLTQTASFSIMRAIKYEVIGQFKTENRIKNINKNKLINFYAAQGLNALFSVLAACKMLQ
jgi:hypothetical protein